ncbi:phage tail protein [Bogoriella caseilytica]|uniref:Microcystin-dependent protein n=1 Tax=Bogoriella caseilytica TaxID=56055 RepID=A0A3N2BCQ3_9MICO|nr:tail fiber protein [Bogoriella caseilytica]ROR72844.1 microcystin-dependent protein [Bogoriella caseilytica]
MEPYIGTIQFFGFSFAPQGWAFCNGQLVSISQNTALFSLLGTYYGGNGQTTFALPDLRGRFPMGQGQGPGLQNRDIGQIGGAEQVTLGVNEIPAHGHPVAAAGAATSKSPAGNLPAVTPAGSAYGPQASGQMSSQMVGASGGNQPHPNMPPYLVGNWCIALVGIFPSRD